VDIGADLSIDINVQRQGAFRLFTRHVRAVAAMTQAALRLDLLAAIIATKRSKR
jgi:hypothetical protein